MFKFVCLVAFSAVASAQWWPQPTNAPNWQQPNWPNQPIAPPLPPIVQDRPPTRPIFPDWNHPQVPQWPEHPQIPQWPEQPQVPQWPEQPQVPQWPEQPQFPQWPDLRPPTRPVFPDWNQPQIPQWPEQTPPRWPQQPPPINVEEMGRPGVRDSRCPATNGRNTLIFAHESDCGSFYMCSHSGLRYTFECPQGLRFDRQLNTCNRASAVQC